MAATSSISGWGMRLAITMGVLGLVSGAATVGWVGPSGFAWAFDPHPVGVEWLKLRPIADIFALPPPLLPVGLFFGIAIAVGIWLRTWSPWAAPVLLVVTMYAWSAAIHVAIRLQSHSGDAFYLIAASLAAGAVGAGITHLGCALFSRELRRPGWTALTTIVGALAGLLFYASQRKSVDERLLYLVWQPAVAFCIGLGLGRGNPLRG